MYRRQFIVIRVLKALAGGLSKVSEKSENLDNDQELLERMFLRRGENIRVSKDPDKGVLWFKKRS